MKIKIKILMVSLLTLMFTNGCSGTYQAYYQTLKIAFSEQKDAEMTLVEVQQSGVDVISVRRGERSAAVMALAYIENGQHKWVSNDNAILVMENGRIIRTLGLSDNQLYVSNTEIDPLKSLPNNLTNDQQQYTWSRIADRTGDEYGYPVESTFSSQQLDSVQALSLNIDATLFVETLSYIAPANYLRLHNSWQNHYWYAKNGELIKSIQKISPLSESLEITYLSRIARLNQ